MDIKFRECHLSQVVNSFQRAKLQENCKAEEQIMYTDKYACIF